MEELDLIHNFRFPGRAQGKALIYNYVYDGSNNLIYAGVALRGSADSDAAWLVQKLTYSGSNVVSIRKSPINSVWNNYLTLTYS